MKTLAMDGRAQKAYLPAAGHDLFLPLYDYITKLLGGDKARASLLNQAELKPGQRVLDIGCGTGTLAILLKRLHQDVEVVGLDPDPKALARAKRKARQAAVSIEFDQGFSDELRYANTSFDHVFSSFMFHHLEDDQKEETLRNVRRVLKPGGQLHLVDFGGPESAGSNPLSRFIHSNHHLQDNSVDHVLALMANAGLAKARVVERRSMFFGLLHVVYYEASAPNVAART